MYSVHIPALLTRVVNERMLTTIPGQPMIIDLPEDQSPGATGTVLPFAARDPRAPESSRTRIQRVVSTLDGTGNNAIEFEGGDCLVPLAS